MRNAFGIGDHPVPISKSRSRDRSGIAGGAREVKFISCRAVARERPRAWRTIFSSRCREAREARDTES